MATDLATLAIRVENGDVVKATTSLNSLEVASTKTERATQNLTRRMALQEIAARDMEVAMRKAARSAQLTQAAFAAAAVAAAGFTIGRKIIEETERQQHAVAQLEAALKSTGAAAGYTSAQLQNMASSLQKVTTYGDDAVIGAEALLLTFTQIRGQNFADATTAVLDLATAMGGDLKGAAVQVGKALNDPVRGVNALQRVGVSFTQAQEDVIKKLVDTGHAADAQRLILKELQTEFGGSAAAARDTLGGALAALKNAFGDLFEVSSQSSQGTVASINTLTTALENTGFSMNKVLHDAAHDWTVLSAAAQEANEIMSLPIGPGFFAKAKAIHERIGFDLNTQLAALNNPDPAKPGPVVKPPPVTIAVDTKRAQKDLDDLQRKTDKYYSDLANNEIVALNHARSMGVDNEQLRAMIEATKQGQDAIEALTIAQAGANAVRELGLGVTEETIAATRREAQEKARLTIEIGHVQDAITEAEAARQKAADDAARDMERRAKDLHRTISGGIEGVLTDIANQRNPFTSLLVNLKRAAIHALAEALATKIEGKVGDFLGITMPATKQEKAAVLMNQAADKMLRAGAQMNDGAGAGLVESGSASKAKFAQALGIAGSGYGGFQAGYGMGQSTGNAAVGAIGGALSGAALGASVGGPVGAVVGGLAGLAGGLLGASDAAAEAAKEIARMQSEAHKAADAFHLSVVGDSLDQQKAAILKQYTDVLDTLYAAYGGKYRDSFGKPGAGPPTRGSSPADDFARAADDYNKAIKQATENYYRNVLEEGEDYHVRFLRATGQTAAADAEAFANQQKRERERLVASFGEEIDARERATLTMYDQAAAAEKAAQALGSLTTALHNAPQGYKYQRDVFAFATPRVMPSDPQWQVPTNPFVPPRSPLNPPPLASTSTTSKSVSITNVFQIDGTKTTRAQVQQIATELKKVVTETLGQDADVSEGWGLLA